MGCSNGHEFEQAPGLVVDKDAWCAAVYWGGKESDTTERLNGAELIDSILITCGQQGISTQNNIHPADVKSRYVATIQLRKIHF